MKTRCQIGDSASFEKTVSESDVYQFAGISGDLNPLHISRTAAEKGPFQERVAHGMLTAGFLSAVIGMQLPGPGTVYLSQQLNFLLPVKFGDTIRAVVTVAEILNEAKGILKLSTEAFNQKNERVVDGFAVVKAPKDLL